MPVNPVRIGSLVIDPPVVNASGAVDVSSLDPDWNLPEQAVSKLGAYVTKSVTLQPRRGNPQPWAEVISDGTLINAVGLANPGIDVALAEWSAVAERLGMPVILSIAGSTPGEFAALAQRASTASWVAALELNLSCPNVSDGLIASSAADTAEVVAAVRVATALPILVKLSPACGDVAGVVRAAESAGADAFTCGNTMPARASQADGSPHLGAGHHGGLSGRELHAIALRLVAEAAAATHLPVIGLGGVDGAAAAERMRAAGATVIGVGTAAVLDPGVIDELVQVAS